MNWLHPTNVATFLLTLMWGVVILVTLFILSGQDWLAGLLYIALVWFTMWWTLEWLKIIKLNKP